METVPRGAEFLEWLARWHGSLRPASLRGEVIAAAGGAGHVAVVVVDLLVGFCREGPLASARVGALGAPAARFLREARASGIPHCLIVGDAHPPDSPEFAAFPPHCIRGTREAEVIPDLTGLPFFAETTYVPKGSLGVGHERALFEWQEAHPNVSHWIVIGDCTDLCVYQAAMHLRLQANARGLARSVWVPAALVETYDLPPATARELGALPHDGDLLHRLFLYHMALNGIAVVSELQP